MTASFALVALEDGVTLVLPSSAFTERQQAAIAHIVRHRGVDALPPSPEQERAEPPRPPSPTDRVALAGVARQQGFTGDACTSCLSFRVKRNGSCLLCEECGQTTGCS